MVVQTATFNGRQGDPDEALDSDWDITHQGGLLTREPVGELVSSRVRSLEKCFVWIALHLRAYATFESYLEVNQVLRLGEPDRREVLRPNQL